MGYLQGWENGRIDGHRVAKWQHLTARRQEAAITVMSGNVRGRAKGLDTLGVLEVVNRAWCTQGQKKKKKAANKDAA